MRMKISERFALNQWLSDYPDDKTYEQILLLVTQDDMDKVTPWYLVEHTNVYDLMEIIEDTRKAFECSADDLVWGVALHDVMEGACDD
jgi:hypothetical protein